MRAPWGPWPLAAAALLVVSACTAEVGSAATNSPPATPATPDVELVESARYVAPGGSDDAAGSESAPWGTLAHALQSVRPGDTLYVRGGTYREHLTRLRIRPATPDAPILVQAYPGEQPVLEGLLSLRNPSWWTLDGLGVTWDPAADSDQHMVKLTNGVGWALTGAHLWGARSFAAVLVVGDGEEPGPADWRIADSCIHDTAATNGRNEDQLVYVNSGLDAGPGVIERNLMFGAPNGAGVKLGGPSQDEGGAADITVRHNTILDTAQSVLLAWQAADNVIADNLLGRTGEGYSAIRGFELGGDGNVAAGNFAFATESVIHSDEGFAAVEDGGGNVLRPDADLQGDGCDGFIPADAAARAYGRTG